VKEFRGKRKTKSATCFGCFSKSPLLTAAEIVSGYDIRTSLRVLDGGAVCGIVAAPDASTRAAGLDELDIMVVTQADTALGVSMSIHTSTGVVLASCIVGIQAVDSLRTDTTGELDEASSIDPISGNQRYVPPKVNRKHALLRRVYSGRRTVRLHPTGMFAIADISMRVSRHDHTKYVCIRDINDILGILSGHQTVPHKRRSEDGRHNRRGQHDQGGGSEEAGHGERRWFLSGLFK